MTLCLHGLAFQKSHISCRPCFNKPQAKFPSTSSCNPESIAATSCKPLWIRSLKSVKSKFSPVMFSLGCSSHVQRSLVQVTSSQSVHSSSSVPSFVSSTLAPSFLLPRLVGEKLEASPVTLSRPALGLWSQRVTCFRDDDAPFPDYLSGRDFRDLAARPQAELVYSPWATTLMEGLHKHREAVRESTGGPSGGGGKGDGDGDGYGGGGGGDGEEEEHIYLLPILTLAFAALHLGYCFAIWLRGDGRESKFGTGLGLFSLLFLAAFRLEHRTGIDAYILGLGASVGSLVWSGERCYVRREATPAGILACFSAGMALIFTAALYHSL